MDQEEFDQRLVDTAQQLETTTREKTALEETVGQLQVSLDNAHSAQVVLEAKLTQTQVRSTSPKVF